MTRPQDAATEAPRKRVPNFWWDYRWGSEPKLDVIVESDDPKHPVIDIVPSWQVGEQLVADLRAGRKDYRRLARGYVIRKTRKSG